MLKRSGLMKHQKCNTSEKQKIRTGGHLLEKAMAPYSSTLAWKSPWMEAMKVRPRMVGSLRNPQSRTQASQATRIQCVLQKEYIYLLCKKLMK